MQQRSKWAILTGVILAMLLASLDQTIVSTAMPTIVQELHGLEHISWVFTAYMLGSTVTVPIYGKLSDIFGRRNLYLLGIVIFLLGSILCGLSQDMTQLILFRGLQGIGGGAMMVNSFATIGDVFPPAERGKYQGIIGGIFGLSSIAGPLLGGWFTDHASWRWVFYVNIPLGIIAITVLASALPKIVAHAVSKKIDWWGATFVLITLVPLLLSLVWGGSIYPWTSWEIITLMSVAIISLIVFIRIEKNTSNPILSLQLFKNRVFLVSVSVIFLTAMGMFGAILYVPIFSQEVVGGSATHAGLVLTPMMIALVTASATNGQIISKTGKYKLTAIIGSAIIVAGLFYFSTLNTGTTNIGLIMRMIVLGLGLGSTMPIFTLAVQSAFPKQRLGEVTAGTQLFRSVGGTVGTAVLGGIMNYRLAVQAEKLQNENFVAQINSIHPNAKPLDATFIQGILSHQGQDQARTLISRMPSPAKEAALSNFNDFTHLAKAAFTDAIDSVFIVAGCVTVISFIIVCFLPEIPLRKSDRPAAEQAGVLLEDELGQSDNENQPRK